MSLSRVLGAAGEVGGDRGRGQHPNWRADGKELYWKGMDGRTVMAAAVELQAGG